MNPAIYNRADGLVGQKELENLKKSANNIIRDLKADGFDDQDILDYLEQKMVEAGQ